MKYPTPDLYDRYTIELLKKERANANNDWHIQALQDAINEVGWIQEFVDKLKLANGQIWDLESDIRKGKEGELGLEEVGRRAIKIREINNIRILIKNKVAQYFGEFGEQKYNHASQ